MKDFEIKDLIITLSATISLIVLVLVALARDKEIGNVISPMASIVVEIDYESDTVVCEDFFTGNLWAFYGADDWEINDVCVLMMNENQEITDVWYSGTVK